MGRSIWQTRIWDRLFVRQRTNSHLLEVHSSPVHSSPVYSENTFKRKLVEERKRAERANKPLVVMLVDVKRLKSLDSSAVILDSLARGVTKCLRVTDICGILQSEAVIGVILTEIDVEKIETAKKTLTRKVREIIISDVSEENADLITIFYEVFPNLNHSADDKSIINDSFFYPDVETDKSIGTQVVKRCIDVIGSLLGLILFLPLFAIIPIFIKLDSRGPVFFQQKRIGSNGNEFELYKFRTMYTNNDDVIHREYIRKFISGGLGSEASDAGVYKIQGDPRVTSIGRFLRKYSIDEIPQFFNVLLGDMSLVGPRPPILYEVSHYCSWQRNRLFGTKPGITGLWQVTARSSSSFDDMVRLDLHYIANKSIILDLKILLRTPMAVLKCKGAY